MQRRAGVKSIPRRLPRRSERRIKREPGPLLATRRMAVNGASAAPKSRTANECSRGEKRSFHGFYRQSDSEKLATGSPYFCLSWNGIRGSRYR